MRMRGHKDKPPDRRRRRLHLLLALVLGLALLAWADAFAGPAGGGPPGGGGKAPRGQPQRQPGGKGGGGGWRRRGGGKGKGKGKKDGGDGPRQEPPQQQQAPRMKPRLMPATQAKDAREAAYLAALAAERDQQFIADALQEWAQAKKPSGSEMGLATLVASVACREAASLDYAIRELAGAGGDGDGDGTPDGKGKQKQKPGGVRLKARQRVVLRTALAQYKYCTQMPIYAIVDHAVGLAKRYGGGPPFAAFANALLRKLPADDDNENKKNNKGPHAAAATTTRPLPLPTGDSPEALAAALSFPPFLVHLFIEDFGPAGARRVMEASNTFPPTMARARTADAAVPTVAAAAVDDQEGSSSATPNGDPDEMSVDVDSPSQVLFVPVAPTDLPPALAAAAAGGPNSPLPYALGVVRAKPLLKALTRDARWYITNGTPAGLIARLAEGAAARILTEPSTPLRVLDVCAAPGGKGLAVWDVVRGGQGRPVRLVMNDVSEDKTARIRENLGKYGLLSPSSAESAAAGVSGEEEEHADGSAVRISIGDGAALSLAGEADPGYDVVIVDAPCSNAGVLGRRPEARWRLADDRLLAELEGTQLALLCNARRLLSRAHPAAEVWYMTCSVLRREDEGLVERACRELGLEVVDERLNMKVLPGEGGLGGAFDGGYGVALRRRAGWTE